MEVDDSIEDSFLSMVTLPCLEEMAAYQVALAIWYGYISRYQCMYSTETKRDGVLDKLDLGAECKQNTDKLVECLKMSGIIEKILKKCANKVREGTLEWVEYYRKNTLSKEYEIHYELDLNCCVWLANGEIDYRKTATKVLSCTGLNEMQRFTIMSRHCMEEDLKTISLSSLQTYFVDNVNFQEDYLLFYWICYLKNELHKIPLLNGYNSTDASMAVMAAKRGDGQRWVPFVYFWNRSNDDDQVLAAVSLVDYACNIRCCQFLERLLSTMSWYQQRRLYSLRCEKIIIKFAALLPSMKSAFQIWQRSKDLISEKQFAEMVKELYKRYKHVEEIMLVLVDFWNAADDRLRNHVLKIKPDEFADFFFPPLMPSPSGLGFLYSFFQLLSPDCRKKLILRCAALLATYMNHPRSLVRLLDLCLPSADDKLQFNIAVRDSSSMRNLCADLLSLGNFEKLDLILEWYFFDDVNAARAFKIEVLELFTLIQTTYMDDIEWIKLTKYIDQLFADDLSLALRTKQQIVLQLVLNCGHDWSSSDNFDKMTNLVDGVFANEELANVKRQICCSFYKSLNKRGRDRWHGEYFDEEYFHKFTTWCFGDDESAMLEFKNGLPLEIVFNGIFARLMYGYTYLNKFWEPILIALGKFLKWGLTSDENVKTFKSIRIYALDDLRFFKLFSERNDELYLEILLKWFFEGDETEIRKFKAEKLEV